MRVTSAKLAHSSSVAAGFGSRFDFTTSCGGAPLDEPLLLVEGRLVLVEWPLRVTPFGDGPPLLDAPRRR